MKITEKNGSVFVALDGECTICEVEEDFIELKTVFGAPGNHIGVVGLDADEALWMDTAYFQLILALRESVRKRGAEFRLSGGAREFDRVCELYGMDLKQGSGWKFGPDESPIADPAES